MSKEGPDGPVRWDKFRLRGQLITDLTPLESRLLLYLWNDGDLRQEAPYKDLVAKVWQDPETAPHAVECALSRLRTKLLRQGLKIILVTRGGHMRNRVLYVDYDMT